MVERKNELCYFVAYITCNLTSKTEIEKQLLQLDNEPAGGSTPPQKKTCNIPFPLLPKLSLSLPQPWLLCLLYINEASRCELKASVIFQRKRRWRRRPELRDCDSPPRRRFAWIKGLQKPKKCERNLLCCHTKMMEASRVSTFLFFPFYLTTTFTCVCLTLLWCEKEATEMEKEKEKERGGGAG